MKRIVVLALVVGGCQASGSPASAPPATQAVTATQTSAPSTAATPLPTPVSTPGPPGLGVAVPAGDWTITVNSVKQASSTNQFIKPDPGNVFWVADITLVNNGAEAGTAGSGITLQDDQDFAHSAEFLGIKKPELGGNVPAGAKTRGYLTFQMTKAAKPRAVIFQPDPFDTSVVVTIAVR